MPADSAYDVVHERTVGGEKYGCHSRGPLKLGYLARCVDPYDPRRTCLVRVKHAMSTACRNYPLWDTDPKCAGCTAEKDTAYMERMKEMK